MSNPDKKEAAPLDPWIIEDILRKEREKNQPQDRRPEIGIRRDSPNTGETPIPPSKPEGNWRRGVEEMDI